MLDSEVPMGPVPCVTLRKLWDRSHVASKQTYGTSPICASENTMGPVPEEAMGPVPYVVLRHLWDQSHRSHGTPKYDVKTTHIYNTSGASIYSEKYSTN